MLRWQMVIGDVEEGKITAGAYAKVLKWGAPEFRINLIRKVWPELWRSHNFLSSSADSWCNDNALSTDWLNLVDHNLIDDGRYQLSHRIEKATRFPNTLVCTPIYSCFCRFLSMLFCHVSKVINTAYFLY